MQIIRDGLNIRTGYHVLETPEDIIINSQMYEKITMEPKPYNFYNTNACLANKNLLLHECNILEYPWAMLAQEPDYKYFIQDNRDSNVFYFITEISSSDQNQYIVKAKRTENSWTILNSISPDSAYFFPGEGDSTHLHYKILGQTNECITVIQCISNSSINNGMGNWARGQSLSYINISKSDMSAKITKVYGYYDFSVYKIKETETSIYAFENLQGNIYISKINPLSNSRTVLFSSQTGETNVPGSVQIQNKAPGLSNIVLFRKKYYVLTSNSSYNGYAFRVLNINFENDTVTMITKNLPANSSNPFHSATEVTNDGHWLQIDLKNVDDTYIAVTWHDKRNYKHCQCYRGLNGARTWFIELSQTLASNAKRHRHQLYKYDEENDVWVDKGIIPPYKDTQHMYGVLYYNQYIPIFFFNDRILAYKLNLETETYEKCFEMGGTFYTIGLDENNRFYTFDNSNKCKIYNDVNAFLLNTKFELDSYNYNNQDIQTYIEICSKNFVDEYLETKVKITLEGNCYFTSNNKKEIITYTSSSGTIQIPVTITYGGKVYSYIKEVE